MSGLQPTAPGGSARTPYGAAELRRVHDANLRRAFAVAAVLAVTTIGGGRVLADALATPAPTPDPPIRVVEVDLRPTDPPSVEPPPAPTRASAPASSAPARFIPEPVSDPAVPDSAAVTLADNGAAPVTVGEPGGDGPPSGGSAAGGEGPPVAPAPVEPATPDAPAAPPVVPEPPSPREPDVFTRVEVMPTVVTRPSPVYPEIARQAGIEGRVYVRARIGRDGRVREASIVRSDNGVFDEPALDAVRQWTFTPGVQAGRAVEVWMTVPIRFRQTRH